MDQALQHTYRVQLLAPAQACLNNQFRNTRFDPRLHEQYLAKMQRTRGRIYVNDGAVPADQLTRDLRHQMPGDDESWHFLLIQDENEVVGCARYLAHPRSVSYNDLRISETPVALDPRWASAIRQSVENDLALVREKHLTYVECGGLALTEELRGTKAALEILLASFAWGNLMEGCISTCTATVRHKSSTILQKVGGVPFPLADGCLPPYFDPHYDCQIQILRFDSREHHPRFKPMIEELCAKLQDSPVLVGRPSSDRTFDSETPERAFPAMAGGHVYTRGVETV